MQQICIIHTIMSYVTCLQIPCRYCNWPRARLKETVNVPAETLKYSSFSYPCCRKITLRPLQCLVVLPSKGTASVDSVTCSLNADTYITEQWYRQHYICPPSNGVVYSCANKCQMQNDRKELSGLQLLSVFSHKVGKRCVIELQQKKKSSSNLPNKAVLCGGVV